MSVGRDDDEKTVTQPKMSATKGAMWLGVCRVISVALSALSMIVLARLLSPHEFGIAAPAAVILALASALFDGALGTSIVRRSVFDTHELEETFGAALMIGLVFALAVASLSPLIAALINLPEATALLAASAMLIFIRSAMVVLASYHQRTRSFRWLATASLSSAITGSASVSIILAACGFGAWSLTIGAIFAATSEVFILYFTADLRLRPRFGLGAFRRLGRDEGAYAATSIANWGALSVPTLIASALIGVVQVGIYSRAQRILEIAVSVLAMPLQRVLLPKFVGEAGQIDRLRSSFRDVLEAVLICCSVVGLMACLHAHAIIAIMLGSQWTAAVPVVQAFMIVLSARCAYKVTESAAIAVGTSTSVLARQIFYFAMAVVGAIVGARYGAFGVAVGTSCAVVGFYMTSLFYVMRMLKFRISDIAITHLRPLALCVIVYLLHQVLHFIPIPGPFWLDDMLVAAIEGLLLMLALALLPPSIVGAIVAKARRNLIEKAFAGRWTAPSRSPIAGG